MSEYQYYDFRAIDRPLTSSQRAELGKISTRAEISSTRFTNFYTFGDFKGNPVALVDFSPMTKRNPGRAMEKENWRRLSRFDPTC